MEDESRSAIRESAKTYKTGAKLYLKGERQYKNTIAQQANRSGGGGGKFIYEGYEEISICGQDWVNGGFGFATIP